MIEESQERAQLRDASRIVVKFGTRLLAGKTGRPDKRRMKRLVREIAELRRSGKDVVLVSSGAIGMGVHALGLASRPKTLPELQMAAAVGQAKLMTYFDELFSVEKISIGQILLTHDDLNERRRHLNARNSLMALVRNGVVPIINENDAVSVNEIKLGDNDYLAALVTLLLDADALALLTTVEGFLMAQGRKRPSRVSHLERVTTDHLAQAQGKGDELSSGGMATKLEAAQIVAKAGALAVIADGRQPGYLLDIFAGADVGTLVGGGARVGDVRESRKRWLAFFHRLQGSLIIDEGARAALEKNGKSLLPIGIRSVKGEFVAGSLVSVETSSGVQIARGIVDYSSDQINKIKGCKTSEIASRLGRKDYDVVIHRDNMVLV